MPRYLRAGVVMALTVSACVSQPDRQAQVPGLFVSPFGEIFLAEPGGVWPTRNWVAGADANADGRLTFEEFAADGQRFFGQLDLNDDRRIRPDEIAVYEQTLAAVRAAMPGMGPAGARRPSAPPPDFPRGGAGQFPGGTALNTETEQQRPGGGMSGGQMPGGQMPGGDAGSRMPPRRSQMRAPTGPLAYGPIAAAGFFNYPQPVKAADQDLNQTITAEEWTRAIERWFVMLDTDGDGLLSLETLPKTPLQTLLRRT